MVSAASEAPEFLKGIFFKHGKCWNNFMYYDYRRVVAGMGVRM